MTKIFVGNFSFAIDDAKLKDFFGQVGPVISAKVMTEGFGGRSRGFGFVEMASAEDAKRAIQELDGTTWEGRVIKVSEDRSARRQSDHGASHSEDRQGGDGYGPKPSPIGYFRAQPLDIGVRKKRKMDPFVEDPNLPIDYKDARLLSRFMSERGRILPRRMTGLTAYHQRQVSRAIKRAQHVGLLPFVRD